MIIYRAIGGSDTGDYCWRGLIIRCKNLWQNVWNVHVTWVMDMLIHWSTENGFCKYPSLFLCFFSSLVSLFLLIFSLFTFSFLLLVLLSNISDSFLRFWIPSNISYLIWHEISKSGCSFFSLLVYMKKEIFHDCCLLITFSIFYHLFHSIKDITFIVEDNNIWCCDEQQGLSLCSAITFLANWIAW